MEPSEPAEMGVKPSATGSGLSAEEVTGSSRDFTVSHGTMPRPNLDKELVSDLKPAEIVEGDELELPILRSTQVPDSVPPDGVLTLSVKDKPMPLQDPRQLRAVCRLCSMVLDRVVCPHLVNFGDRVDPDSGCKEVSEPTSEPAGRRAIKVVNSGLRVVPFTELITEEGKVVAGDFPDYEIIKKEKSSFGEEMFYKTG